MMASKVLKMQFFADDGQTVLAKVEVTATPVKDAKTFDVTYKVTEQKKTELAKYMESTDEFATAEKSEKQSAENMTVTDETVVKVFKKADFVTVEAGKGFSAEAALK